MPKKPNNEEVKGIVEETETPNEELDSEPALVSAEDTITEDEDIEDF